MGPWLIPLTTEWGTTDGGTKASAMVREAAQRRQAQRRIRIDFESPILRLDMRIVEFIILSMRVSMKTNRIEKPLYAIERLGVVTDNFQIKASSREEGFTFERRYKSQIDPKEQWRWNDWEWILFGIFCDCN